LPRRWWLLGIAGAARALLQEPDPQPATNLAEAKACPHVSRLRGGGRIHV
jgi:hypothetical protein